MFGDLLNQGKSGTDRDIADLLNRITGLQSRQTRCTPGKEILDDRFRSISGQLHAENPVDLVLLNRPPSHADDPDPQWQLLQTRSHQELSEFRILTLTPLSHWPVNARHLQENQIVRFRPADRLSGQVVIHPLLGTGRP